MIEHPSVADDPGDVCEYQASDGLQLKYRHWRPRTVPKAYVIALHGIQSHSGWYGYSSRALAEAGVDVRFLDRRGSGLNEQDRGHAACHLRLMDDVTEFARTIEKEKARHTDEAPMILLGLSWGARLTAAVSDRDPDLFDGLILLYPGLYTHVRPTPWQRGLLQLAGLTGAGRLPVPIPLVPEQFASEPQWQAFVRDDPLSVRRVSVSFLIASERLSLLATKALEKLTLPRLVMLAGEDEIVDIPRTRELVSRMPREHLRVVEYPDARHTLEFEPGRDRFVADLIGWIESM